jgi:hypothetical protein
MPNLTVGCKLVNGVILGHQGKRVALAGAKSSRIIGGYGMTEVDKDFFDAWCAANADSALLSGNLVFAQERFNSAAAQAKEQENIKTGFEPIDPERFMPGVKAEAYEGQPEAA